MIVVKLLSILCQSNVITAMSKHIFKNKMMETYGYHVMIVIITGECLIDSHLPHGASKAVGCCAAAV